MAAHKTQFYKINTVECTNNNKTKYFVNLYLCFVMERAVAEWILINLPERFCVTINSMYCVNE